MLAQILHLAVGLLGLVLLYVALFLTETAEGNIQNRLEALWVRVDDLSKVALSRQAAFLQQVSKLLGALFDKLFGTKLISAKAAATSICFSSAAPLLLFFFAVALESGPSAWRSPAVTLPLLCAVVLLAIGLAPVPVRYLAFLWVVILAMLILYSNEDLFKWKLNLILRDVVPILAVLAGSIASDVFFISVSRWYLRKSEKLSSAWRILSLLSFNLILGLLLVSPLIYGLFTPGRNDRHESAVGFFGRLQPDHRPGAASVRVSVGDCDRPSGCLAVTPGPHLFRPALWHRSTTQIGGVRGHDVPDVSLAQEPRGSNHRQAHAPGMSAWPSFVSLRGIP